MLIQSTIMDVSHGTVSALTLQLEMFHFYWLKTRFAWNLHSNFFKEGRTFVRPNPFYCAHIIVWTKSIDLSKITWFPFYANNCIILILNIYQIVYNVSIQTYPISQQTISGPPMTATQWHQQFDTQHIIGNILVKSYSSCILICNLKLWIMLCYSQIILKQHKDLMVCLNQRYCRRFSTSFEILRRK